MKNEEVLAIVVVLVLLFILVWVLNFNRQETTPQVVPVVFDRPFVPTPVIPVIPPPTLEKCNYPTMTYIENSPELFDDNDFETQIPGLASSEGLVYRFTSFLVDGVELLSAPFDYTTVGHEQLATTTLPNPHNAVFYYDGDNMVMLNESFALNEMFEAAGVGETWYSETLLDHDATISGSNAMIIYNAEDVSAWSITLLRYDGEEIVFAEGGSLIQPNNSFNNQTTDVAYDLCLAPELVTSEDPSNPFATDPVIAGNTTCSYRSFDITEFGTQLEAETAVLPIDVAITSFIINGKQVFEGSYELNIADASDLNFISTGEFDNYITWFNEFFASIGLDGEWSAANLASNFFDLTYPNSAVTWALQVSPQHDGGITVYQPQGLSSTTEGFVSSSIYAPSCTVTGRGRTRTVAAQVKSDGTALQKRVRKNHEAKKEKLSTPLTYPPPQTNDDIRGLLRERMTIVHHLLEERGLTEFHMALFGSQTKTKSRSGSPDIDILVVTPQVKTGSACREFALDITEVVDFKLDLNIVNSSVNPNMTGRIIFTPKTTTRFSH